MLQICDSIAVKTLANNHILLGVGNNLRYCSNASSNIIIPKTKGKIHGINLNDKLDTVLVYSERQFILFNHEKDDFKLIYSGMISDWISSGKLLQNNRFCLVTGHLATIELEYNIKFQTCAIINKSYCLDKTTLYCSYILGNTWDDLIVFGGTAMNVIVLKPATSFIIQRLSGKNGVTLSIDISREFNIMITTSDDRSLKIYNCLFDSNSDCCGKYTHPISPESFIQSYGHTARVFQGKIIGKKNLPYILTVGEDSNLCIWDHKGHLLFRRLHHFGAPIWNLDYDYETDTIFTTSSDGNCKKYDSSVILSNNATKCKIDSLGYSSTVHDEKFKTYKFEKIAFLCDDRVMIGLANQNILITKIGTGNWIKLENLLGQNEVEMPLLKNKCSILRTYKNLIFVGSFNVLIIIKFDISSNKFELEKNEIVSQNYIKSILILNDNEYLVCDEIGNCKLFNKNSKEYTLIKIQKGRDPWVTCAFKSGKYFVLSNRQGHLFLYIYENNNYVFKNYIKHVNGSFGVTNICLKSDLEKSLILKTYGHDNTVKIIKVDKEMDTIKIISRENIQIAWVEKVFVFLEAEYMVGFNSTNFVLWNKIDGELFNYNCGGGHRFWDCVLNFKKNTLKLIFIRKGQLHIVETNLKNISKNSVKLKQFHWHIKECNILKQIDKQFFASGGEDNILKISKLKYNLKSECHLSIIEDMNQHISNIRAIAICKMEWDYFIFSAGGRAQICVSKFNIKTSSLEEVCNFMLKSTDFERNFNNKGQQIDFDPETRFMTIEVFCNHNKEIEVFAGCSDGYIRKFIFMNENIRFIDELFYNRCILQIRIIKRNLLLSASTDGLLKIWNIFDFSSTSEALFEIKHHESGINAIDIAVEGDNIYIITGGDDQNVVFSTIKHEADFTFCLIKNEDFNFLHTAQVTGVKFEKNMKYFYSTAVDQTVCKFSFQTGKLIKRMSMCVADIKGLELLNECNNEIAGVVYGCGIESF